jgi:hypothetical protein
MDSDKSVTASFVINTYALSVTAVNGSVSKTPNKADYTHGETVTLEAVPDVGYHFANWSGDLSGSTNPATITMNSDKSVTANFSPDESDQTAPYVTNRSPQSGEVQVPLNNLITLHIVDEDSGVEYNGGTVTIHVDGDLIYDGTNENPEGVYDSTGNSQAVKGVCRRVGSEADYAFVFQPLTLFEYEQKVDVVVSAADKAGNEMTPENYHFYTVMRSFGANRVVSPDLDNLSSVAPATVCDKSGNIWVAWHAGAGGQRDVYVSKMAVGDGSFAAPVQLTTNASDQSSPDIAVGTDDKLYVAWQDNRRGNWDIYATTSGDGVTWSSETQVSDSNDNQVAPAIVVDARSPNRAHIAWQDDGAGHQDIYVASSADDFATKTVSRITTNTSDQTAPDIAVDASNTVYLVWTDDRSGSDDIYGAASNDGPWTNVPVATGAGSQSSPAIAAEAAGSVLHFVWVDDAGGNSDVRYGSSNAMPPGPLTGTNIVDDTSGADQTAAAIITTGSTGNDLQVFVCWQDFRNVATSGDTDLYFVEVRAEDGTNILVGDDGTSSDQSEPAIGVDIYGYPYVLWTDDRSSRTIYYAGSTYMDPDALASQLIDASADETVGVAPPSDVGDVSVVIPAGACLQDVTITIREIQNPQSVASGNVLAYDFGPSGLQFSQPVTITIPYAVAEFGDDPPLPYWYNSLTGTMSQEGITDIEDIAISADVHALRFKTTHFTSFYLTMDGGGGVVGGGGGGGGGCSMSHAPEASIIGFFLPYGALVLFMLILKRRDRKHKRT